MSQTSITSFFTSRKRPASDDIATSKSKIAHLETTTHNNSKQALKIVVDTTNSVKLSLKVPNDKSYFLKNSELNNVEGVPAPAKSSPSKDVAVFSKKTNISNAVVKNKDVASSGITSARQELSLGDIRKKLAGSSRLAELRAAADRLSKKIQNLKESSETKRNLKEFKSIDVEVPSSPSKRSVQKELLSPKDDGPLDVSSDRPFISPRKVVISPIKSPSKLPAYIRHACLATSTGSLPLPHHYRFLGELFRGMETVVSLLYNRNEKITFNKLKPSVQEMLKRNFTEKHLAQIKHLVPDFYNFEVQKSKGFSSTSRKEIYELVITPNFPSDVKIMNPSILLERRRYFFETLLQLVKKHHTQYLLTLDPPMVIPDSKLTRWHPEFEIEKVPEVDSAKLPEVPNKETYSTAQDVLAKARELFKCNTKMERALERLAQAKERGLTEQEKTATGLTDGNSKSTNAQTQTQPSTSGVTLLNPALRNLPAALLEKVKAKQAAKALEAMTRSSENEEKYLIYSRLPDLVRTLRNIYVTERKNVLALNIILSKLDSSFKSNIALSNLQKDIKLLTETVPEWVKLHEIRNTMYLKLDKNSDLKTIISKLEALAEKYKCN